MKLNYRPEIDGLRAIAVVAVILYHPQMTILGHQPFKGGFIGVDIFFVISGYLITSIILKELITTETFSFKNFYERRIRRILPALLLVMLVSLPFAWMYLLPISFIDFSKSILYSLGFSSNFYFHYSGQQYGAESGLLKPFLHTWSLSVEEQFYILFPIVLLITFKYFKKYIVYILILGFVISLGLADWGSRNHPYFNFYVLPTRGWELLAGSILAYFEITLGYRSKHKTLNLILPSVGLFLIGHSILFFNDKMFHPSFYTLSPIIGVCLVIWFSNKEELTTKILSSKLFVGIGLISYSLYLWHYPIFAFARITGFTEEIFFKKILLGVIILLLSIVSYYLIERPARNRKYEFKKIFIIISTSSIILILSSLGVIVNKGFVKRFPGFLITSLDRVSDIIKEETGMNIYGNNVNFSNDLNKKHVVLVGDSHAVTLTYALWKNLDKDKYNFSTSLYGGCQFILNVNRVNKKTFKIMYNCSSQNQNDRYQFIKENKNSIIILFSRLPLILEEDRFNNTELGYYEGEMSDFIQNDDNSLVTKKERQKNIYDNYKITIENLLDNNHEVILVYPMPEVAINIPETLYKNFKFNKYQELFRNNKYLTTSYNLYKNRTKSSFELLDSIQSDNVYRVYPHTLFCNTLIKDRCVTHDDKNIFYRDDDHPSLKSAEMINELIMKEIKKIELKSN